MADPTEETRRADEARKLTQKQAEFLREQAERARELQELHKQLHPEKYPDK